MLFSFILFVLSFAGLAVAQNASLSAMRKAFYDADIPQSFSLTFDPKVLLEVTFPQPSGEAITLHAGAELPRNATVGPPLFGVVGNASPGPFVIALIDPDTPTPQDRHIAQVRHYLGGNFVFADSKHSPRLTNTTPAVTEFIQPRPRAGSDLHRYVFLLFEQSAAFNNQTWVTSTTPPPYFNISTFAAAVGLGQPIGGTYMLVGPDRSTA